MAGVTLKETAAADVPTPATAKATIFMDDSSHQPAYKDAAGASHSLVGPAGATGPAGADGADGADGTDGADGVGVPTGGTTGQVLTKASNADYDTEWDAAGLVNPMSAQDDIIIGGASGTPARLAKGSDGQVLSVDPATHHLVWATPSVSGGSGGPTGVSVPKGTTLARSYDWASNVQSWSGSGLSWSSAGWIQLSAGGNGSAVEPSTPSDGDVEYSLLWRPHMAGQGGSNCSFDFHLTSALGDAVGFRLLLDYTNSLVSLQRRYNDLGVISTQTVLSVQMRWKGDPVIDFLVRYETQNATRIIQVFAEGSLMLTYPGGEFTTGYCRFFVNNAVCRVGGFKVWTA